MRMQAALGLFQTFALARMTRRVRTNVGGCPCAATSPVKGAAPCAVSHEQLVRGTARTVLSFTHHALVIWCEGGLEIRAAD